MFHICAVRFDVTENFRKFLVFEVKRPILGVIQEVECGPLDHYTFDG